MLHNTQVVCHVARMILMGMQGCKNARVIVVAALRALLRRARLDTYTFKAGGMIHTCRHNDIYIQAQDWIHDANIHTGLACPYTLHTYIHTYRSYMAINVTYRQTDIQVLDGDTIHTSRYMLHTYRSYMVVSKSRVFSM